jgi:hypothetical protein
MISGIAEETLQIAHSIPFQSIQTPPDWFNPEGALHNIAAF